jgi:hypothetical protein
MKLAFIFISVILVLSCNQPDSTKKESDLITDTSISNKPQNDPIHPEPDSAINNPVKKTINKADTALLMSVSTEILKHIKARNYKKLALFIHPQHGLRFSPYAGIDTTDSQILSSKQLIQIAKQNKQLNWGSDWDDEADKPKLLTIDQYFKRFVYDVDFLNAELKSINKYHSQGTDLNNINEIYPDCNVVEFFFHGFEKKYEGMDFRALRLVFKTENNKPYLVAIVHDEWTP